MGRFHNSTYVNFSKGVGDVILAALVGLGVSSEISLNRTCFIVFKLGGFTIYPKACQC